MSLSTASCWKTLLATAALPMLILAPLGCASQQGGTKEGMSQATEVAP